MTDKKRDNPIGYRPSKKIKPYFEKYCQGDRGLSKSQFIDIAMNYLVDQGETKMKKIILDYFTGNSKK